MNDEIRVWRAPHPLELTSAPDPPNPMRIAEVLARLAQHTDAVFDQEWGSGLDRVDVLEAEVQLASFMEVVGEVEALTALPDMGLPGSYQKLYQSYVRGYRSYAAVHSLYWKSVGET